MSGEQIGEGRARRDGDAFDDPAARTPSREVAEALGVTREEARALIAAGAMDAWEPWSDASQDVAAAKTPSTPTTTRGLAEHMCLGRFVRTPHPTNSWHSGAIALAAAGGGGLEWVNDAGVRWELTLRECGGPSGSDGVLETGPTNPYFAEVSGACVGFEVRD